MFPALNQKHEEVLQYLGSQRLSDGGKKIKIKQKLADLIMNTDRDYASEERAAKKALAPNFVNSILVKDPH